MRAPTLLLLIFAAPLAAQPSYGVPALPPAQPSYALPHVQPAAQPMMQAQTAGFDQQIAALSEREQAATQSLTQLETEIAQLSQRREAIRSDMHRRARALYRMRRAGMLPVAGGFHALLGHLSRVERVERMVQSDLAAVSFLRSRQEALRGEVARQRQQADDARVQVAQLQQQRQLIGRQMQAQQAYAGIFDPAYAPRLPMMPTTQPVAPPAAPAVPNYGVTLREAAPSAGFAALRGRLQLPVAGGAVREAQREDGRGLEFVSPGASIVASADGRVAFSQRYGGYGTLVILDHGDEYFTLYGGLAQTTLAVGEWVGKGARIGTIASQPLFFGVRQGTRSLDPRSWVGL